MNSPSGQLGPVLEVSQQVRQLDIGFLEHDCCRPLPFDGLDAGLANGNIGLAPLQTRP